MNVVESGYELLAVSAIATIHSGEEVAIEERGTLKNILMHDRL